MLTPYEQAKRYADHMVNRERPSKIIVCNFQEFRIYDLELVCPERNYVSIQLNDLDQHIYVFDFLTKFTVAPIKFEEQISIDAGKFVRALYEKFESQYDMNDSTAMSHLSQLCVRLVFAYYAEDAGLFNKRQFLNYLLASDVLHISSDLSRLFDVLNTPLSDRDKYLPDILKVFPYVNGGLFREKIAIPNITQEALDLMIHISESFDWSNISPTVFGACFENTLNPLERSQDGEHYTPLNYIHMAIDLYFLIS